MAERYEAPPGQIVTWYGKLHYQGATTAAGSFKTLCNTAFGDKVSPNAYVTAEKVARRGFCKSCIRAKAATGRFRQVMDGVENPPTVPSLLAELAEKDAEIERLTARAEQDRIAIKGLMDLVTERKASRAKS